MQSHTLIVAFCEDGGSGNVGSVFDIEHDVAHPKTEVVEALETAAAAWYLSAPVLPDGVEDDYINWGDVANNIGDVSELLPKWIARVSVVTQQMVVVDLDQVLARA